MLDPDWGSQEVMGGAGHILGESGGDVVMLDTGGRSQEGMG